MKFRLNRGFTLVELLVVVAIIAILSVIGITIFTSAQSSARDARRKSDIDAIANALEVTRTSGGTLYYSSLLVDKFSGAVVPVDNSDTANLPHYCIRTSNASATPTDPSLASWANNVACSNTNGSATESPWVDIASYGLQVGGTGGTSNGTGTIKGTTLATSAFGASVIRWKVCARLEATNGVYCKSSSQ